jgi:hypothetical protein
MHDLIRYHHVLKSHYLDSKRNRRIDRVVYTLIRHLEPHFQSRHERQTIGFEGPDLAAARRAEINASARDIPLDSVLSFDSSHFHVASQSRPGDFYAIDLLQSTCDCPDFPRIRFCKHIAAVNVHFPHLCPEGNIAPIISEEATVPSHPERVPESSYNTLRALLQENALLLQTLSSETETMDRSADYSAMVESARSTRYGLLAANASVQGTRALPEKDVIAPNQKTWPETAVRMGVKPPRKQKCLPEERGLTAQSIGVAKSKKRTNPFGGRPGKRAKPDAVSASANEDARANEPSATPNAAPFPLAPPSAGAPPSTLPSAHAPSPASSAPLASSSAANTMPFSFGLPSASAPPPAFPSAPPTFNFGPASAVPFFPPTASVPAPGIPYAYPFPPVSQGTRRT